MVPAAQQEQVEELFGAQVLYDRLRELTAAGLIDRDPSDRYRLTPTGRSPGTALDPLDAWSKKWARSRPEV